MKMKKILGVLSLVLLLVGCSSGSGEKTSDSERVYKVGILQFAQHHHLIIVGKVSCKVLRKKVLLKEKI